MKLHALDRVFASRHPRRRKIPISTGVRFLTKSSKAGESPFFARAASLSISLGGTSAVIFQKYFKRAASAAKKCKYTLSYAAVPTSSPLARMNHGPDAPARDRPMFPSLARRACVLHGNLNRDSRINLKSFETKTSLSGMWIMAAGEVRPSKESS